ncbi:MAG: FadR/GntR family transcriptional regulator [Solirubrobacteraceae bacterium]
MSSPELQPVSRTPLYELVVDRLREFIDVQQLEPGDRLMSERELAQQLGVSRSSVRQALTALKVVGLIEIRHGDGIYLLRSPGDVIPSLALEVANAQVDHPMIWEVREGVETQAARLAARRRTKRDLVRMRQALDAMAASVAAGGDGVVGDRHFHQAIWDAAHNEMLSQVVGQLREAIDRTSEASLTVPGRPPTSLEAHEAIFAAIEDQDEGAADTAMRAHVAGSAQSVAARKGGR